MSDHYPPSPSHTTLVVGHTPSTAETGANLGTPAGAVFLLCLVAFVALRIARRRST